MSHAGNVEMAQRLCAKGLPLLGDQSHHAEGANDAEKKTPWQRGLHPEADREHPVEVIPPATKRKKENQRISSLARQDEDVVRDWQNGKGNASTEPSSTGCGGDRCTTTTPTSAGYGRGARDWQCEEGCASTRSSLRKYYVVVCRVWQWCQGLATTRRSWTDRIGEWRMWP